MVAALEQTLNNRPLVIGGKRILRARAHSEKELVTFKQLIRIRVIAGSLGINFNEEARKLFGCEVEELTTWAASAFGDYLKAKGIKSA